MLSGVPQGTVLGPLLFLFVISDINKDVSTSKLVSFVEDTILYSDVGDVTDCDNLQLDLNAVYDWASSNNTVFNSKKFSYVCFSSNMSAYKSNLYIDPVDCGRYSLCNSTFLSSLIKEYDYIGI